MALPLVLGLDEARPAEVPREREGHAHRDGEESQKVIVAEAGDRRDEVVVHEDLEEDGEREEREAHEKETGSFTPEDPSAPLQPEDLQSDREEVDDPAVLHHFFGEKRQGKEHEAGGYEGSPRPRKRVCADGVIRQEAEDDRDDGGRQPQPVDQLLLRLGRKEGVPGSPQGDHDEGRHFESEKEIRAGTGVKSEEGEVEEGEEEGKGDEGALNARLPGRRREDAPREHRLSQRD